MGFGELWRSWIRACLQSASTSILVNGSPTPEFSLECGLRQGDPLSPFLFILVMEGLHLALEAEVHSHHIKGVTVGNLSLNLSRFFFVDDVIILPEWDRNDLRQITRSLNSFYRASGLKINISKSNLFGVRVSDNELQAMAHVTGCQASTFPLTYLGLPIGKSMHYLPSWNILVNKFKLKLSTWKASLLSIDGRLTLIKSVLGSLGICYLSLFKAPESVINTLERHRARFFWGGYDGNNKMVWVRWKNVLASLKQGGLGIGILKAFNLGLLQKWRWRFTTNPNLLWVKLIKAIHSLEARFDGKGCATC
ncbi:RNA-directed DNA polymerase, eukaryota, reverse transcriptase zinc-binding domain protein [Tanacetum coccineum]